jgi:hypothetical protein
LAQYPDGRTRIQVALLTGYAHGGGGFSNYLSALRTKGWLEGDSGRLRITGEGLAALGPLEPLPTGKKLRDHWLERLGRAERLVLAALTEGSGARAMSREELAARTGYAAQGGGFSNALSRLRTLGLVTGRAEFAAEPDLFDGARTQLLPRTGR